jgi:glycosyltransferase involved in cell wall biosynthesis
VQILLLSAWFPYPPTNGSKLRVYNLLRALAPAHTVTLISFAERDEGPPLSAALASLCRKVITVPAEPFRPSSARARLGFFSPVPRSLVDTYSAEMARRISEALAGERYDLVISSELTTARYARCFQDLPALFEDVELGALYDQFTGGVSARPRWRHSLTWMKHRHFLARLLRRFRACTVASEHERALVAAAVPDHPPIHVVPNGVYLADYDGVAGTPEPNRLVFAGSFRYFANHDAMVWFLGEVYPRIQARIPDVHLTITGHTASRPLPPARHVKLAGHVDDVCQLVAAASVSVAPIRIGSGTRVKILEAMALGTPVVATSKGAEGLEAVDGEHLLIGDSPAAFAERVVDLLRDATLRERLAANARQFVADRYDWRRIGAQVRALVAEIAG